MSFISKSPSRVVLLQSGLKLSVSQPTKIYGSLCSLSMDWLYLKKEKETARTMTLSQHVYSYFHLLGNWRKLVSRIRLNGCGGSAGGRLHFLLSVGANIKHQDGTGIVLKVTRILRCHLILNCKCSYEQLDKLTRSHKRLREWAVWLQFSSPF